LGLRCGFDAQRSRSCEFHRSQKSDSFTVLVIIVGCGVVAAAMLVFAVIDAKRR
jgi:hypothetical protein